MGRTAHQLHNFTADFRRENTADVLGTNFSLNITVGIGNFADNMRFHHITAVGQRNVGVHNLHRSRRRLFAES